jgi:hypothetical protein
LTSIGTPSTGEGTVLRGVLEPQKRTPLPWTVQGIPRAELIAASAVDGAASARTIATAASSPLSPHDLDTRSVSSCSFRSTGEVIARSTTVA